MKEIVFDPSKFQELILYLAHKSEDDPRFGATKLNKLLFYTDIGSYRMLGKPVTGATYQHLPAGPAPKQFLEAKRYLVDSGHATMEIRPYFAGAQERLVPQRDADLSQFSPEELEIADSVLDEFWEYNARRISDYSHQEWAWLSTTDFEDMPYYRAWVSSEILTPEQIEEGQRIAKEQERDYSV